MFDGLCPMSENIPAYRISSMKTGGVIRYFLCPSSASSLVSVIELCISQNIKYKIVGNSSNLLYPDEGFNGAVIGTSSINAVSVDKGIITSDCGVSLSSLAMTAAKNSLSGMEGLYGIPGTLGGAVMINAGAYGTEICDTIISACVYQPGGGMKTMMKDELSLSYRHSALQGTDMVVISASFKPAKGNMKEIKAKMNGFLSSRKEKQPLDFPSCGSAFKRPDGGFASALIDECGLKGFTVGGAAVSEKHAGFIINTGSATSKDVVELIKHIQRTVYEKKRIMLEPEIEVL